jgi:hypothetical protein
MIVWRERSLTEFFSFLSEDQTTAPKKKNIDLVVFASPSLSKNHVISLPAALDPGLDRLLPVAARNVVRREEEEEERENGCCCFLKQQAIETAARFFFSTSSQPRPLLFPFPFSLSSPPPY